MTISRRSSWSLEDDRILIENANLYSFEELSKMLNKDKRTISSRVSKLGITNIKNKSPRYTYDKDFFKDINNEEKAYWLGFIAADGCIVEKVGSKKLKIALKRSDRPHLDKFVKAINGDIKVYDKISNIGEKKYESCEMSVNCTEMCNDLINLGVGHNKTTNLRMPKIQESLIKHFIRGFIDGDGCIYIGNEKNAGRVPRAIEIVGYKGQILQDINDYFIAHDIASKIYFKRENNDKLFIGKQDSINKLVDIIYVNSTVYLDRKYEKALLIRSM